MAATWPTIFQERLNQAGFKLAPQDVVIRSSNEIGPPKSRTRSTKRTDIYTGSITIKIEEWDEWDAFFTTTLNNGVTSFLYKHPFTQVEKEWRFAAPYAADPLGGEYLVISMSWELLP